MVAVGVGRIQVGEVGEIRVGRGALAAAAVLVGKVQEAHHPSMTRREEAEGAGARWVWAL